MSKLKIKSISTNNIREEDIIDLEKLSTNTWASSTGDYLKCRECGLIMSKRDIFGHLEKNIYKKTIDEINRILNISNHNCISCKGDTSELYGEEYRKDLKYRFFETENPILTCAYNEHGEIVGFNEGFYDTIENVYKQEFERHYGKLGYEVFLKGIKDILGYIPEKIFVITGVCLNEENHNFLNMFNLMKGFSKALDGKYDKIPCIAEVDKGHTIHEIVRIAGAQEIDFKDIESIFHKDYESVVTLIPNIGESYNRLFGSNPRDFRKNFLKNWQRINKK